MGYINFKHYSWIYLYDHRQLGDKATFQGIKKAGHLVHLERPCVYNRHLKLFLASLNTDGAPK